MTNQRAMATAFAAALFVSALASATAALRSGDATDRPIIGILSLPNTERPDRKEKSYFPASYVKFLEMGGARVVPLVYTQGIDSLKRQLKNLNGALFTGGGAEFVDQSGRLTEYGAAGMAILDEVRSAHENNETWPLWGTCLGFEFINVLVAYPDTSVLTGGWDSENYTIPLEFTAAASKSRMFGSAPPNVLSIFSTQPVTMNNHHSAVDVKTFLSNRALSTNFTMLSTNRDRKGNQFVSAMEGQTLPIYATQFHPEKPVFEWRPDEVINHSSDSVLANSYFPRFFVDQARKNGRRFPSWAEESAALIYNYPTDFTGKTDGDDFDQCYFFD